ncbi:SDR family NAD(P)-dependent oxidoreductase, partial [Rhizobium johnstonii]
MTLVTGASRGIGRACALACAAAGYDIVLGVRDVAASASLAAELE